MLFWLSAERGFSQAAYSYLCEEVLWFEGRWSDRRWMETGAFLLPSRITWISPTSSAANPPKEERTSQPILAQRVRTRRPVADDDNTSLNITSAQLYLDDIRSENMNRAHQLIFWSCVVWQPCFRDPRMNRLRDQLLLQSGLTSVWWQPGTCVTLLLTCSTVTCWGLFGRTELQYLCPW